MCVWRELCLPNTQAIEILTDCYVLVQGNTVAAMGGIKGLKAVRHLPAIGPALASLPSAMSSDTTSTTWNACLLGLPTPHRCVALCLTA